jgi:hypothetical protein
MISFQWGQIVSFYNAEPAMLFIVSFVEKELQRSFQVGIMASENVSEQAMHVTLEYHSSSCLFDQSGIREHNTPN